LTETKIEQFLNGNSQTPQQRYSTAADKLKKVASEYGAGQFSVTEHLRRLAYCISA
jgi:hypothetical protein